MGGLKAGEGQGELVVREIDLDGGPLGEEPFLREGTGSAFVSRPGVLVQLTTSERGLALLPKKVEQLIGRGFHAVAVRLEGERLAAEAWGHLRAALSYADQFAGFLVLCGVSKDLQAAVEAAAREDGKGLVVRFVRDQAEAAAELRKHEAGVDPLEVGSADSTGSADTTGSEDDWGGDWGSSDTTAKDSGRLPRIDVSELVIEADELPGLRDRVQAALKKGKRYFTLRMHFRRERRLTSDDLHALVAARDSVSRAGGQLILAALQDDVVKWLKLMGEERHFLIAPTADDAERTHRRHADGEETAPAPTAGEAGFVVVAKDARSFTVRPAAARAKASVKTTTAPARVIALGRDGLSGLAARAKRLASEGVHDVVGDLGRFKEIRGERFDELPKAVEAARKAGTRLVFGNVSREVKALLKILGVAEGGEGGTTSLADGLEGAALRLAALRPAFEELRLELTTEELVEAPPLEPVSSVDLDEEPALAPSAPAPRDDKAAAAAKAELASAKADAERAVAERDALKRRAQELEAERDALKKRAVDVEAQARRALDEVKERVEKKLEEQRAASQKEAERAKALAGELEQKKKRVAELELTLQAGDAQVEEVQREAAAKTAELEGELSALRERAQELEAGAFRMKQLEGTVAERDKKVAALEGELQQAMSSAGSAGQVHERRIAALERELTEAQRLADQMQALEAAIAERDRQVATLEVDLERARSAGSKPAAAAPVSNGGGDDGLRQRVSELERENARILTEAEQEIQRLMKEQQLLREELESAGEMIERLGKELEYS